MQAPAFFDAHCDTVIKVHDAGAGFIAGSTAMHLDFPRLTSTGVRAQVFACFVLSERYPGEEAQRATALLDTLDEMILASAGGLEVARSAADLRGAFEGGPAAAIVGLEGADPLEDRAENIRAFYDRGVRDVIFAWKDNAFSGTASGKDSPLTREGRRLLGLCEELGAMVDVSHLSDSAFAEVCAAARMPFIASHSNCRAICPSPRNLTDEMIRALADRGGVMGINLSTSFLSPETLEAWKAVKAQYDGEILDWRERERIAREIAPTIPRPPFEWIVKHVRHAIDVGGEDVVGLGGDLDGILHLPEGIDGVEDYGAIPTWLREAGLTERQIGKLCHRNLLRVFEEVLPRD
jgi:membrane dipeptidase